MDDRRVAIRKLSITLLALVAALLVGSCASGDDRLGGIPDAPAGGRELTADEMPFDPDIVAEGFKTSLDADTVQIRVYSFATGTTFAQLAAYYENLLPGQWVEQSSQALETARAQGKEAMIWVNDDSRELFSLQYVAAPGIDGNVLVVIYAQRR